MGMTPDMRYAKCEMRNAILRLTDPQLDRIGAPPPRAQIQSYSRRERRRKRRLRSFQHLQNGGLKVQTEATLVVNTDVPTDCAFVLNEILLKEGSVFEALLFSNESYQTAAGVQAPSQWRYGQCQVSVNGRLGARENLTLFDIALTANRILSICDLEVSPARGGMSLIGDVMNGFFVNVEGYAPKRYGGAVNVTSIDSQPVTASSERGPESQQDWESL
ncbi:MAG: hypothetical protein Q9161_004213 [Pseudevernia consocians]